MVDENEAANIKQALNHLSIAFRHMNNKNIKKYDAINELVEAQLILNGMIKVWETEQ